MPDQYVSIPLSEFERLTDEIERFRVREATAKKMIAAHHDDQQEIARLKDANRMLAEEREAWKARALKESAEIEAIFVMQSADLAKDQQVRLALKTLLEACDRNLGATREGPLSDARRAGLEALGES